MRLPHHGDVRIDERKIRDYLLCDSHPVGRFKARVFAAVEFDSTEANAFMDELRRIADAGEIAALVERNTVRP